VTNDAHSGTPRSRPPTTTRRSVAARGARLFRTIQSRLLVLTLSVLLPAIAAAMLLILDVYHLAQRRAEEQMVATARALALAVDRQFGQYEAALRALGTSPHLAEGAFDRFHSQASRLTSADTWVLLLDMESRQLVNTRVAYGTPLPVTPHSAAERAALTSGRVYVCDLFVGPVAHEPVFCVSVPAVTDAGTRFDLSFGIHPRALDPLLAEQKLPPGWYGSILDASGTVVARNADGERFLGRKATPDVLAGLAVRPEGVHESVSLNGVETLVSYARSPVHGWSVVVAAPRTDVFARPMRNIWSGLATALLLIASGVVLSLLTARSIRRPVRAMAGYARLAAAGRPFSAARTGLAEIDETAAGLGAIAREARHQERQVRLIADSVPLLISHVGPDLRYRFVNRAYREWHRRDDDQMVGRTVEEILGAAGYELIRDKLDEVLAGRPVAYERWMPFADGRRRYVRVHYEPHRTEEGGMDGFFATVADLTERRHAEERQELLAREVDHRAKNLLAVVQSVIRLTRAPTLEQFMAALEGRLAALARAHTLLASSRWNGGGLEEIVRQELAPFPDDRVGAAGPAVVLSPDAVQPIAMVLHELTTNAAKYGALSTAEGTLAVSWSRRPHDLALELYWTEEGGPAVVPPVRSGFGSAVLETSIRHQLDGSVRLEWRPEGLRATIVVPRSHLVGGDEAPAETPLLAL